MTYVDMCVCMFSGVFISRNEINKKAKKLIKFKLNCVNTSNWVLMKIK